VPRDGRIILTFDLPWLWIYEKYKLQFEKLSVLTQQEIREKVEPKVKNLKELGEAMQKFGDFYILDSDPLEPEIGPVLYRLDSSTAWMYGGGGPHILPRSWSTRDIFVIILHCIVTIRLLHGEELCT
jgi:hypothetical protein